MDSDIIYWLMSSTLMLLVSIYIFKKSRKTLPHLFFAAACLVLFSYDIAEYLYMGISGNPSPQGFKLTALISVIMTSYILISMRRYDWRKLKGNEYNPSRVQAIYSRPNTVLTLLGAWTSLSPKCSVRYSYNGKMVRFKKGYPTPIMTNIIVKPTDIIENTDINPECFYSRYDEIKGRRFNLFRFNCRSLFKDKKSLTITHI